MKDDGYCTSSKIIKTIINECGINSFKILQILEESILNETVLSYETKFLQLNDIKHNDLWYNMHNNDSNWYDQEFVKNAMLKKYGVANAFSAPEIIEKIHNTNLEKYGVKHPLQNKTILNKMKNTTIERYGVDNPAKTEEVQNKMKNTTLERYGVDNYGKTEEAKKALSKRSSGAKFYNDGNKNYFVQSDQTPDSSWVKGMKPRKKSI